MASVALFNNEKQEQIPRQMWTKREREIAKQAARDAIENVGEINTDAWEDSGTIIALRRQCRDEERRQVMEKYLSYG